MTSHKLWIFAILMIFGSAISFAAVKQTTTDESIDGVYIGTIGSRQVVLEFGREKVDQTERSYFPGTPTVYLTGRFLYLTGGIPFPLYGEVQDDGSIVLREQDSSEPRQFDLTISGRKATGECLRCRVPHSELQARGNLRVSLIRVSSGFDPDMKWNPQSTSHADQAFYDFALKFPVQTGAETLLDQQISYVSQTDQRYFMTMPRLVQFPDHEVMRQINQDLLKEFNRNRLAAFQCKWDPEGSRIVRIVGQPKIRIAGDLFTLEFEGFVCGGPPSTDTHVCLAYSLKTGNKLKEAETSQLQGCLALAKEQYRAL